MGGTGGTPFAVCLEVDSFFVSRVIAVPGRGVSVAAGVSPPPPLPPSMIGLLLRGSWLVVRKLASEIECTLTMESDADESPSRDNLRRRSIGAC